MLAKTPLDIQPRRELPRFSKFKEVTPLIDLQPKPVQEQKLVDTIDSPQEPKEVEPAKPTQNEPTKSIQVEPPIESTKSSQIDPVQSFQTELTKPIEIDPTMPMNSNNQKEITEPVVQCEPEKLTILGFEAIDRSSPSKSPQLEQWDLKQTSSLELLTPSPSGFTPFDSRSIDELMTPDDFGSEHLAPGLSNINYDIDLSDFSGDNSIADDIPKEKDPFSPEGIKKDLFDPFAPQTSRQIVPASFDEFSLVDSRTNVASEPFDFVPGGSDPFRPKTRDPFTPITKNDPFRPLPANSRTTPVQFNDPFNPKVDPSSARGDPFSAKELRNEPGPLGTEKEASSILDDNDSPTTACLLPSPLLPQSNKQT